MVSKTQKQINCIMLLANGCSEIAIYTDIFVHSLYHTAYKHSDIMNFGNSDEILEFKCYSIIIDRKKLEFLQKSLPALGGVTDELSPRRDAKRSLVTPPHSDHGRFQGPSAVMQITVSKGPFQRVKNPLTLIN